MDLDAINKNIDDKTAAELKASKEYYRLLDEKEKAAEEEPAPEPVDIYQRDRQRIRDVNQKSYPKGSSPAVNMATYAVIDGVGAEGLAKAFKRAKEDVDRL